MMHFLHAQEGDVVVNCHNTGDKAVVSWVAYSKAKERYRELNGQVFNSEGEVQYLLHGAWDKGMVRKNPGESPSGVCVCVCDRINKEINHPHNYLSTQNAFLI